MLRRLLLPTVLIAMSGCAIPSIVRSVHEHSPAAELGRPGWVQGASEAGAWVGGAVGAVFSIAALPLTWPLSALSGDAIGEDADDLIWAPATLTAGAGIYLFGVPCDFADWGLRRAWIEERPTASQYEFENLEPPVGPRLPLEPLPAGTMGGPESSPGSEGTGTELQG